MLVFLYGPPGSGKSTLGRALAGALDVPFVDLDAWIEEALGKSIPQIFAEEGEAVFREYEHRVLQDVVARYRATRGAVVALGGGTLLREDNRRLAEDAGLVLCLTASEDTLLQRVRQMPHARPLLPQADADALRALLTRRGPHYASFPRCLNTQGQTLRDLVWEAQIRLGWFRLRAMPPPYDVEILSGLRFRLSQALRPRMPHVTAFGLVSDVRVYGFHGNTVLRGLIHAGWTVHPVVLPEGEQSKSLATAQRLWETWLHYGLDRYSVAVALGGGVVGDVTGFAAATFMRGIPWVNIPTSLLAMVDAAFGGKTGIDLPQAKNAVGAFHPPAYVAVDPEVLNTLPEPHWRYGLAEVVKHALIGDPVLWETLVQGRDAVQRHPETWLARAMAVKIRIVENDPWERTGLRAQLNAGHTIGHAIEAAMHYAVPHGVAVAIGLVVEAALAEALGLASKGWAESVETVLRGLGLPVRLPAGLAEAALLKALTYDKKRRGGMVPFALPVAVGQVHTGVTVPEPLLRDTLARFSRP